MPILPRWKPSVRRGGKTPSRKLEVFPSWYSAGEALTATERESYDILATLAERHPLLEESAGNTKVGIGVATGLDQVFVRDGLDESIEPECQLPLVMAADIAPDRVKWSGTI
ncbi:MAG: hypothetical protein V9F82_07340 [Dermatophilaceae bacterium]